MSEPTAGHIDDLQQDIVTRLEGESQLSGIPVLCELVHDVASKIETALGSVGGICIVVTPPVCNVGKPNLPGPYFDSVTLDINIPENPPINQAAAGKKLTASHVAELVAKRLHRWQNEHGRCLLVGAIRPVADPQFRVYRVPVTTAFGL